MLKDYTVVVHHSATRVADTLSRRAREGSDAAKPVRQLFPHVHIFLCIEPLSLVVGKGQEDLNQLHVSPRRASAERRRNPMYFATPTFT